RLMDAADQRADHIVERRAELGARAFGCGNGRRSGLNVTLRAAEQEARAEGKRERCPRVIANHLGNVQLALELIQRARHSLSPHPDVVPAASCCFPQDAFSLRGAAAATGARCEGDKRARPRIARTAAAAPVTTKTMSAPSQYLSAGNH